MEWFGLEWNCLVWFGLELTDLFRICLVKLYDEFID